MATNVNITIDDKKVRSMLFILMRGTKSDQVKDVAGRAAVNLIRKHLRHLDASRPNKIGGKRGHYYAKAANSTHHKVTAGGAVVSITHTGFYLRYHGGTIRPIRAKTLAIPARRETYGYRPRELGNKMFVHWGRGKNYGILATNQDGALRVMYWLVKQAKIKADKSLLPETKDIRQTAVDATKKYINNIIAQSEK